MSICKHLCVAALVIATLTVGANAWWCTGHMIVAEIARVNLNAGVETQVNAVIQDLQQWGPFPMLTDMVPAACWADDLKSDGLTAMHGWHFINQPYLKDGFTPSPRAMIQGDNVAADIDTLDQTAQDREGKVNKWEKAFAVANLLHFIGDIHQPLHATELYDSTFPQGDHGGNSFSVNFENKAWRLHFIWDSVCGKYQGEPIRPLNSTARSFIQQQAQDVMKAQTISPQNKSTWNATTMAQESYTAAVQYAYADLSPNDNISPQYVDNCLKTCNRRLAQAGYRLAAELNYIFKASDSVSGHAILSRMEIAKKDMARIRRH